MVEQNTESLPIDKGWAWVVLIAVSVTSLLEGGLYKSFGVFFVEYVEKFGSSASTTSLVSGLFCGVYSFTTLPLMAFGLKKISCRMSVIIGGFLLMLGYLFSSLANTIEVLILAQSFFTGAGAAFVHGPSLVVLGRYFERRRGMANGIASAFSSLGGLVLPLAFHALVLEYYLEGALLITSGLVFNIAVAGAFLRSVEFYTVRQKVVVEKDEALKSMLYKNRNNKKETMLEYECIDGRKRYSSVNSLNPSIRQKTAIENRRFASMNALGLQPTKPHSSSAEFFSRSIGFDNNLITYSSTDLWTKDTTSRRGDVDLSGNKGMVSRVRNQLSSFLQIFDASFMALMFAVAFGQISCGIGHVFIPPYAIDQGIPKSDIPILVSIIGAGNLCGRILVGLLADIKCVRQYLLISSSLILTGTTMFFVTFFSSFVDFVVLCILYGMFSGCLTALYAPVCVEIIGLDKFNKGMAMLTSIQGLSIAIAAPILGMIKDATGSYVLTFYVMGTTSIFAGLSLICVPCAKRCTLLKQKKSKDDTEV